METPEARTHSASTPGDWLEAHGDYLYACAIQKVGNPEVAEDLVQETFLAGLKAGTSFAGKASERSWFVGILKHKVADHFRKKYRDKAYVEEHAEPTQQPTEPFDARGRWDTGNGRGPEDWPQTPSDALEQKEFWLVMQSCLALLPERMAEAFLQHEVKENRSDHIMSELNISSSNLWVLLHRARLRLRECLEQKWFGKA